MQAAHEGHYTDQELNILWKQKIGVRKTIQQLRPTTSSTASSVSSKTCYDLTTLTSANSDNLPLPTSHPSGQASLQERRRLDDHGSTDTNNTTRRRRGVEQQCVLPPAQQPNTSSESYEGPPANDSSSTSSGGLTLKIDTHEANAAYKDNTPLQKTPTESLKDSLKRFGMMGELAARFPID
ncbi:hypothetical protein LTS08_006496 [Lithohypha guttulata]|nr:hypothetical protein LTS08_006496 [Lithohypha guttulata]